MPHLPKSLARDKALPSAGSPLFFHRVKEIMEEALGYRGNFLRKFLTLFEAEQLNIIQFDKFGNFIDRSPVQMVIRADEVEVPVAFVGTTDPGEQTILHSEVIKTKGNKPLIIMAMACVNSASGAFRRQGFSLKRYKGSKTYHATIQNTRAKLADPGDETWNGFETRYRAYTITMMAVDDPGSGQWSYELVWDGQLSDNAATSTTITAGNTVGPTDTTIPITNTTGFADQNDQELYEVKITRLSDGEFEYVAYVDAVAGNLTSCVRGMHGTTPLSFDGDNGDTVDQVAVLGFPNKSIYVAETSFYNKPVSFVGKFLSVLRT